ncbi:MAG: ABC transporter ATP-binding protein [Proteobacteria bacterium]|nr:ABC transporter ATP-binding protein [Pseudomonadota bacterium]
MTKNATEKISLRGVKKSFITDDGPLEVLGGLDLTVATGQFVAIVGPSGAGKTTLINVACGFTLPDAGSVLIDGVPRHGPSRKGILISQQGSVFPWMTVRENLLFALDRGAKAKNIELAQRYIDLVKLQGFENSYPHELSGGMLKRVEIARALVLKPEILYMDEPFSALDALMRLRMRTELLRILEEEHHTVLLITHDVEEAIHLADQIVVMSPRPAVIQATFAVPFPHPRQLSMPEVQQLKESILRELGM